MLFMLDAKLKFIGMLREAGRSVEKYSSLLFYAATRNKKREAATLKLQRKRANHRGVIHAVNAKHSNANAYLSFILRLHSA